ncbi:zinc finger, CCHC-type containing protein [Tanacetum coccineum]
MVLKRTTVVLVPKRNLNWNVRNVARLVTLRGIAVVETRRITQMPVVRERGLRTNPKTKVDTIAWWIDSGATTHVCKDHCWFKTYEPMEDGSVLYMGGDHFTPVHRKGSVVLEFSSVKSITLFNVLIIHETIAPYTPQQNGVAEKKNRALKEMVNYMLSYSGLSDGFWGEAMAVVRLPDQKRKPLGEKGIDCIFFGYAEHSKEYRYLAIGRHLEEIHVTWAHLEKKRTRLRTNTKTLEDLCSQRLETASPTLHDTVTTHLVTASQHFMTASARTDLHANLEYSIHDGVKIKMLRRHNDLSVYIQICF